MSDEQSPLTDRYRLAVRIAKEAGELTLGHFRSEDLQVERKQDQSPVTAADRAAETWLRERIAAAFPGDGILGEEFGETSGDSGFRWILDPIDGTKSFIHGVPLYTTLIGVERGNHCDIGVIYAPATDEIVHACRGQGAWTVDRSGERREARVSTTKSLAQGLVLTTEEASFWNDRPTDALDVWLTLQRQARLGRTWGDAYGYLLVATGRAEAMLDPALNVWDAAALQPVLEEAGGTFTDWNGTPTIHAGEALGTNGLVLEEVLAVTRGG